jgi:flagellar M-ring protein FliF
MAWKQQFELLGRNLSALGARRIAALSMVGLAIAAAVGTIGFYASRPETEALYVGLTASDTGRIGAALREAGIAFDVSSDGTKVLVRRAQAPHARMLLAEKGLPAGGTAGYELFDKLGPLGLTSFMQEVTRTRALEGELARTIQTMKGIKSARVHIVAPDQSSFRKTRQPASASVVIRMEGVRDQSAAQIIRHLVSSAVPGLAPEHVNVVSTDGSVLAAGGDGAALGSGRMIELERSVVRQLQENIQRTLAPYLGIENFEVSVAARINMDKRQTSEQVFDPESRAERSTRVVKESGNSLNAGARATVSVEQNVPGDQASSPSGEQSRKTNDRKEELTNFELSSKNISTMSEGHRVEALNVAIVINRRRLAAIAGGTLDEAASGKLLKEVEAIAGSAAGLDTRRGDRISVAAVDFLEGGTDAAGKPGFLTALAMHLDTFIIAVTAISATAIFVGFGLLPSIRAIITKPGEASVLTAPAADFRDALPAPVPASQIAIAQAATSSQLAVNKLNPAQSRLAELIERDEKQVASVLKQWLVKA